MTFRNTLADIYHILKEDTPYIFVFFIGSYPLRQDSNHENPIILNKLNSLGRPIKKIYIDAEYSKDTINQTLLRVGNRSLIYPKFISPTDYTMILEFCHIAGILNNSLSIIMEFTGSIRKEPIKEENKTRYLYITPNNCLGNTDDILYKPIIEERLGNLHFYNPEISDNEIGDNLYNEIIKIFQSEIIEDKFDKLKFIEQLVNNYIILVRDIYRMLLNYIERKDCFTVNHNVVFRKNEAFFYPSLELLKNRMIGYNLPIVENIIDIFVKSDFVDLEIFIGEKIQYYISLILLFINNGDDQKVNENYELLMFNNSQDVLKIINKLDSYIK
tara:strand:+ start:581 stop:1567 length:987 start_codon:yes stop_codon:yes gene_type:complete